MSKTTKGRVRALQYGVSGGALALAMVFAGGASAQTTPASSPAPAEAMSEDHRPATAEPTMGTERSGRALRNPNSVRSAHLEATRQLSG